MNRLVNAHQHRHWDARRRYRDPRDPVAEAFARPKVDWLAERLGVDAATSVLDVGAGNGMFTWWWATRAGRVEGVELSANMIRRSPCAERLHEGDAYALPFPDASFDVVFAGNLLHHLTRPWDALAEMRRVSRGRIAICEGNRNHVPMAIFGAGSRVCRGVLHYSRRTLTNLMTEAGLEVLAVRAHGYVYENQSPPATLPVARRLERVSAGGAYLLLAARDPQRTANGPSTR